MMHETVGKIDELEEIKMAFRYPRKFSGLPWFTIIICFRVFDTDGDRKISKDEFRTCMLNYGERFGEDEIEEMVKLTDNDEDGSIDYVEFVKMITSEEQNISVKWS